MFVLLILFWILLQLSAPKVVFLLWGAAVFMKCIDLAVKLLTLDD